MLRVAIRTALLIAFAAGAFPDSANADGGRVRLREEVGAFIVSLFTADPLRAGSSDISVLVQDRTSGLALLDAQVDVTVEPVAHGGHEQQIRLTHQSAANKLLAAGAVLLDKEGAWRVIVTVRRGADQAQVACHLQVEPPAGLLSAQWPALSVPPFSVLLFLLHQRLKRQRSGRRSSTPHVPAIPPQ